MNRTCALNLQCDLALLSVSLVKLFTILIPESVNTLTINDGNILYREMLLKSLQKSTTNHSCGTAKRKNMKKIKQAYSNHRHLVPLYHFLTFAAMAVLLLGSILYFFVNKNGPFMLLFLHLNGINVNQRILSLPIIFPLKLRTEPLEPKKTCDTLYLPASD